MSEPDLPKPDGPASPGRSSIALWFVALALVSLAVVPVLLGRRLEDAQTRIAEVLEPAGIEASHLSLLGARQMARFQAFLLTGDRAYRAPYIAALAEERDVYERLSDLTRTMDDEVRTRLARLSAESIRWHFEHQRRFDAESVEFIEPVDPVAPARTDSVADPEASAPAVAAAVPPAPRPPVEPAVVAPLAGAPGGARETRAPASSIGDQREFDRMQRATQELERAIQSEINGGRREMNRLRARQTALSVALAALALGATLVVARVGSGLRSLTSQTEGRRREAVRARREIDALLEATGDGVLGIDLDGKCMSLNRAGGQLLGFTEREIRGRDVHATLQHAEADGADIPRDRSPILAALAAGRSADSAGDDVLWRRDRTAFPARWSLRPLLDGVELRGAVLTFTDVTKIHDHQRALRKAIDQREEVVSIVSHDLRNPLGVVAAAADLLLDLPLNEGERRQQAEIIRRSAERMGRLIEDLLDVARIEAGAFVVRPAREDVGPFLEEVCAVFLEQARAKGVALSVADGEQATGRFDRDRVLQAIVNLLDNALRHTPAGGWITLASGRDEEGQVTIAVSDTGPGIPPAALEHLFDRFYQADSGPGGSAGLGLSIVRGVAEAHGGTVSVHSVQGEGTTFTLHLPGAPVVSEEVRT